MDDFPRNLLTEWRALALPFKGETFVVGVSGGADSVALALALHELKRRKKLDLRLVAAHFNHNLRGRESDEDEKFVRQFAGKYDFELALKKCDIAKEGNLEQNARIARYAFLSETAGRLDAYGVLTAHTLNDQAETFLINLIRGSGLEGLGAMRPVHTGISNFESQISKSEDPRSNIEDQNKKSEIRLIRPLLRWAKRKMTEKHCRNGGVEYRSDAMNEDLAFRRVRVRKILIPLLEDFNPKIIENLAKTAFLLQEDFEALEQISEFGIIGFEGLLNKTEKNNDLEIKGLRDLFPSMRRKILRDWLKSRRGSLRSLDSKHIEAIENLAFSRKSGKTVELPGGELIIREKGKILFAKKKG